MPNDVMQKKVVRKNALTVRNTIPLPDRMRYDAQIGTAVADRDEYQKAQVILAYASYQSEVGTSALIARAFEDGKEVFLPKVSGDEMVFFKIMASEKLSEGYRGIPEPEEGISFPEWVEGQTDAVNACKMKDAGGMYMEDGRKVLHVMMWMPGAAFDKDRHRIGYGKGFYDRYLSRMYRWLQENHQCRTDTEIRLTTAALAYHCQVFEQIPGEPHDIRPDMLITEQEIYCAKSSAGME